MKAITVILGFVVTLAAFTRAQNETSALVPLVDGSDSPGAGNDTKSTDAPPPSTNGTSAGTTAAESTTTTTSAPVTTTVAPEPKASTWYVRDAGVNCIVAKLGARFTFNYTGEDSQPYVVKQDIPAHVNASQTAGSCSNSTHQNIKISYAKNNSSCTMTLNFINKSNKFSVDVIDLNFGTGCFDHAPKVGPVTGTINQTLFQATVGQSYLCNAEQDLNATKNNINSLLVELVDVQLQAFSKSTNTTEFGTAQECPQDAETSNIVPIAVGAALAALVLIVLIAYLISRNRGQRGYESV